MTHESWQETARRFKLTQCPPGSVYPKDNFPGAIRVIQSMEAQIQRLKAKAQKHHRAHGRTRKALEDALRQIDELKGARDG